MKNTKKIKRLAVCAIMIALATILSLYPRISAPYGGSITVGSMVPIMLISIIFGFKWGLPVAFGYSAIQLMLGFSEVASWGLSIEVFIGCMILDYILAFSVLSVSGFFGADKLWKLIVGTVTAGLLRYLCHFVSGLLFFGMWAEEGFSPFTWSIVYNGAYMLPDTIICVVVMIALYKVIPRLKS